MRPTLAVIIPVGDGPIDPGYGNIGSIIGGGHPSHPIYHPGHPDHGLPSVPGHPGNRPPGSWPGHPDQGLPGGGHVSPPIYHPGHPDHGLPSVPGHPDNSLPGGGLHPWLPGHGGGGNRPDQGLPPGVQPKTPYGSAVALEPPAEVNTTDGAWVLVNVQGTLVWAWAQKPPAPDQSLPSGKPPGVDNTLPETPEPK